MSEKYANIMLLGRTGVGKSSFINYLVGEKVCKVGTGEPVTQGFDTYKYNDVSGLPLQIFDSKGLEVGDYQTIKRSILSFIKQRCGSSNVHDWMHSIFYCINVKGRRLEPEETEFIKSLTGAVTQTVHIIMTHCRQTEEGVKESGEMERYIRSQLRDERIRIYCVNSTAIKTRKETESVFGREEILNQIFEILWSDISRKTAAEYARELYSGMCQIRDEISYALHEVGKEFNTFKMITDSDGSLNKFDKIMDRHFAEMDVIGEKIQKKYQERTQILADFCNSYGQSMGIDIYLPEIFDFDEFDLDLDIDSIMERTKTGRLMNELDDIDDSDLWGVLQGIGKGIGAVFSMKQSVNDMCDIIVSEINQAIPSVEQIEKTTYDALMEAY